MHLLLLVINLCYKESMEIYLYICLCHHPPLIYLLGPSYSPIQRINAVNDFPFFYSSFSKTTQFIDWSNQTCGSDGINIKHQPLKVISQPEMSTQILFPPSICLSPFGRIFLLHLSDFCDQVAMSAKSLVQAHMTFRILSKYSKLYKKLKAQPNNKKVYTFISKFFENVERSPFYT